MSRGARIHLSLDKSLKLVFHSLLLKNRRISSSPPVESWREESNRRQRQDTNSANREQTEQELPRRLGEMNVREKVREKWGRNLHEHQD